MSVFTMTIDGKAVKGDSTLPVVNPATGAPFAECPDCSREQLDAAVASSLRAFPAWRNDEARRRQALLDCAEAIKANLPELAQILTQEQGKPLNAAMGELMGASIWFQVTAGHELPVEVISDTDEERVEVRRKPLGVVAAITPWNFPIILAVWKIAPALLAGNTLVLKPSPYTPLSSLKLGEILSSVLPPGVLNVVSGGDGVGVQLTQHPDVRKISFTGSVPTGKKIMAVAAPDLKRVTLELGGNDPAVVLADADPQKIAENLFWGGFENAGQICMAVKRVYVEESNYQPLVAAMADIARGVVVGNGLDEGVRMGPINNAPQYERVLELLESAKSDGGTCVTGGEPTAGAGYFLPPTIVTGIADGSRLVDEEQFGPVLPIIPVKSAEEAIEKANATHFGLGGSIWTGDVERGAALASQLECGTGWVNRHGRLSPLAPFGGSKWSGIGYENGKWGLSAFTQLQVISIQKDQS
jgi:acyl-CoA reductase-like NAD-dependent aldehyde dehydrogenase